MPHITIILIAIGLSYLFIKLGLSFLEDAFNYQKIKVNIFSFDKDRMIFFDSKNLSTPEILEGKYSFVLPDSIDFHKSYNLEISFNQNRGVMTSLNEIYSNGTRVWNKETDEEIKLIHYVN